MIKVLKKSDWFHEDGFPIVVEKRFPQEPFGLHAHEFSEIVIITGGTGLHVTGDDSYQLSTGDTFVIGGSRPHDYLNLDNLHLINILYDPTSLPMTLGDLNSLSGYQALFNLEPVWRKRHQFKSRLHLKPKELAVANGIIDHLSDELERRESGFRLMGISYFMQLVGFLSRCYSTSMNPDSRSLLLIAEAISFLESHYSQPMNLDDLAHHARMSKRSFIRAFESATGCTPISYLIQLRINHAMDLLRKTEMTVTEIAYAVGFNDSNYFARQFRKLIGTSPRSYRRQHESFGHLTQFSSKP